ncbi:MAG: hypothetical protein R3324_09035, partial [Halobacteriales archaeon]|nr:hypothetical protein [Halobacteriales archaeon]
MLFSGSVLNTVLLDPSSGETVARIPELSASSGEMWAIAEDGRHVARVAESGSRSDPGRVSIIDGRTGEELHRVGLDQTPTAVSIDDGMVLAGLPFGRVVAISPESGEVMADVPTTSASAIIAVGLGDDGQVIAVAEDRVEALDLESETVRSSLPIDAQRAVVQPDGTAVVFDADGRSASLVDLGAPALAEQVVDVSNDAVVGFGSGRAAMALPSGLLEIIELDTGDRSLIDPESAVPGFEPVVGFPTSEGVVMFGTEGKIVQLRDEEVVQPYALTDRYDREISFAPPDFAGTEAAYGPADASSGAFVSFTRPGDGANQARPFYSIDWSTAILRVEQVEARFPALSAVATDDGRITAVSSDGRMRTYDSEGRWLGEMDIGVRDPLVVARSDRELVAVSGLGGVVVVDPLDESSLVRIEGLGTVAGMAFAPGGERLVTLQDDGTVRLWDVSRGEPLGMLVGSAGPTPPSTPWFDPDSGTVWVASSGRLLE